MNNSYWDYLEHHGILGQKWGKQNGPPYPLNPADYSAAEKRLNQLNQHPKTIEKNEEKINKLRTQAAKDTIKSGKYQKKALKNQAKAGKMLPTDFRSAKLRKVALYEAKAAKFTEKAGKKELKAIKLDEKNRKMAKQLLDAQESKNLLNSLIEQNVSFFRNEYSKEISKAIAANSKTIRSQLKDKNMDDISGKANEILTKIDSSLKEKYPDYVDYYLNSDVFQDGPFYETIEAIEKELK